MPSRGKAVSKIKYSAIDEVSASIEHLPALVKSMPEEASGIQVIARMYSRLLFLKEERNYNYSDLADFLKDKLGLDLLPETVRSYMSLVKKEQSTAKRKSTKGLPAEALPVSPFSFAGSESIASTVPIAPPVDIELAPAPIEAPIPPAIADTPSPSPPPKAPLRPGEWSHAELRKHFNKY